MSNNKRLQGVIYNMLRSAGTPDPGILNRLGPQPASPLDAILEPMAMAVQQLEMGMMQIAQGQQAIGTALDASRLTVFLLVNMLIEKGIFTKEEWEERYKVDVVQKMQDLQKQIQEKLCKQMEEQMAADTDSDLRANPPEDMADDDLGAEEEQESADLSDIILPSEREDRVVRFPSSKKEED